MKFSQLVESVMSPNNRMSNITVYAPGIWKRTNGNVTYYCNSPECRTMKTLHRLDGPAVEWSDGIDNNYYINGKEFTEREYWQFIQKFKENSGEAQDLLSI
jgi:hypothetical protein